MSTLSDLEDAIRAHTAETDGPAEAWPLVAWVLYTAQTDADGMAATQLTTPDGQIFYTTLGLLHAATNEADHNSVSHESEDDDD